MKKKIVSIVLTLAMSLSLSVPAFAEEAKTQPNHITGDVGVLTVDTGVINANNVRIRETPGLSGSILTTLSKGQQVEVGSGQTSADGYTWYYVIAIVNGTTYSGYVASIYVDIIPIS